VTLKRTLTILAGLLLLPVVGSAQQTEEQGLSVSSDPTGALVKLEGDATVTGVTPAIFRYPFTGDYRVTIKQSGYEAFRTDVSLEPGRMTVLNATLTPKARAKAMLRSLVIPGWGQLYAEKKAKGLVFLALSLGASAAYLVADHNFDIKFDRFERRLTAYDSLSAQSVPYSELAAMSALLADAQEEAYDSEDVRRLTIGAVVAVWGLNVLDALLTSPGRGEPLTVEGLTLTPNAAGQSVGLTLSHRF
jgi:hypothetical protein